MAVYGVKKSVLFLFGDIFHPDKAARPEQIPVQVGALIS